MTNEFGEPNQAESHRAEKMSFVLWSILRLDEKKEKFSVAMLIKDWSEEIAPNTIRTIKNRLFSLGIIEQDLSKKYPNNEKFYRIKDLERAKRLEKRWTNISEQNEYRKKHGTNRRLAFRF